MKPFDLEAAKRGEPVVMFFRGTSAWEPVHFVGMDSHGQCVFQRKKEGSLFAGMDPSILRMAPKTVTVRYRVAIMRNKQNGYIYPEAVSNGEMTEEISNLPDFFKWACDWQTAEIQGGE